MFQKGPVITTATIFPRLSNGPTGRGPTARGLHSSWQGPNIEEFPYGEGLAIELNPKQREPDIPNYTWRDWGNRVGVWRMIELMDEFRIQGCLVLNGGAAVGG